MLFLPFLYFQIMMVSLFLARHDQYLIMFKDSNSTIFHSKQSITILQFFLLITIVYSRKENKKKKLLKQFFD